MPTKSKKVRAKVAAAPKSNFYNRFKVRLKLKSPTGVRLSQGETEALGAIQYEDVQLLKANEQEVLAAIGVTRSIEVGNEIKKAQTARSVAATTYRNTKDPIKKREWARRLVVADTTRKSLIDLSSRMLVTRERLEMIAGDIALQVIEAEAKVAETSAYAKAGKQLRLAGENLVSARSRAKSTEMEYTNLEITMEGAEKMIANEEPEDLIKQADAILGIK